LTQDRLFSANVPWTFPPQQVPATAQHILPAFWPLLIPSKDASTAAGQTPRSATFLPPGCLSHFLNCQQLIFLSAIFPTPKKTTGVNAFSVLRKASI
jgi:hypothetical protein